MDLHELFKALASPLIAAASLAFAVVTGRGKARKDEQDRLESRIAAVEQGQAEQRTRLAEVELTVRHLPTREQFHAIELSFAAMAGDMKVLTGGLARVEDILKKDR